MSRRLWPSDNRSHEASEVSLRLVGRGIVFEQGRFLHGQSTSREQLARRDVFGLVANARDLGHDGRLHNRQVTRLEGRLKNCLVVGRSDSALRDHQERLWIPCMVELVVNVAIIVRGCVSLHATQSLPVCALTPKLLGDQQGDSLLALVVEAAHELLVVHEVDAVWLQVATFDEIVDVDEDLESVPPGNLSGQRLDSFALCALNVDESCLALASLQKVRLPSDFSRLRVVRRADARVVHRKA